MAVKREFFEDFINNLFHIELKMIEVSKPKLHSTEQKLFNEIYIQIDKKGIYLDDNSVEKRIKNRLKNKISSFLESKDILLKDKELRKELANEISFFNVNDIKKHLRKLLKRNTNIDNIHSFLIVFDELRNFYFKVKEQNEIKAYYDLLDQNLSFIDTNLAASYFLRELDLDLSMPDSINRVEKKIKKLEQMIHNEKLIDGYLFRLDKIICEHKIKTGEWEEAKKAAMRMENNLISGKFYSRENISKIHSLFVTIYNQTYDENKFEYYLNELDKSNQEAGFLEKQILSLNAKMSYGNGFVSKEMLSKAEKMASKSNSERIKIFLRVVRTQYHINNEEFNQAKNFNDIFFVDIHNNQVKEFLDRVYIQRFIILYRQKKYEEIINLFNNKITQRRLLSLEKKGRLLIYPYIIFDLAMLKSNEQGKEVTFENIYRMLDFYHYYNYLSCYNTIKDCIQTVKRELKLKDKELLKINQLKKVVEETIGGFN